MVKKVKKRKAAKAGEVAVPPDAAPVQKSARKRRSAVADADKPGPPPAKAEATEAEVTEAKQTLFQTNASFSKLGLAKWIVQTCAKLGMNYPTDIQAMCIPDVLAGKNLAGNARTGSGKTACYSMPILHHLSKDPYGVFALILVPVRELAFQVTENFRAMGQAINVKVGEIVGGRDFSIQSKMIADRTHVIVATPGRLADLLRGDFALAKAFRKLHTLVLDEDQLLTQTFEEPLGQILELLPKERQTLFFSATITQCIQKLKKGKDLTFIDANPNEESLENLTQLYVFVPKSVQVNYLHYLLRQHFPEDSCIVFAATIEECQLYTTMLDILGFEVTGLHSLQTQRQRLASLGKFRASRAKILIATDVAARLPYDSNSYVHRAGRTARAGRPGKVVSLMSEFDVPRVQEIEKRIGKQLQLLETKEEDAIKLLSKTSKAQQRAELLLSEVGFTDQASEYRGSLKAKRSDAKAGQKAEAGKAKDVKLPEGTLKPRKTLGKKKVKKKVKKKPTEASTP